MRATLVVLSLAAVAVVAGNVHADEPGSPEDVRRPPPVIYPEAPVPRAADPAPTEIVSHEAPSSRVAPTGALRAGLYADGDQTIVFRALGALALAFKNWSINGSLGVDVVSSSSVDVRSSAGLSKVDVVSTASGTSTSGGKMSDRRIAATLGGGWHRDDGRAVNVAVSYANEKDYNSVGLNLNGSVDVNHRMTTLLGGVSVTHNWIGSTLDKTFSQTMFELGWSAGFAQVLGQKDAIRLRYDGALVDGYQGSPYRSVRFGNWTTSVGDNQQLVFANTIGPTGGLAENEPTMRVRNALVFEWLHSLSSRVSLFPQLRGGIDTWHLMSISAALDLRGAWDKWRVQLGYRFYAQSSADFYQAKYLNDPSTYSYYTSDKELGKQYGHVAHLDISRVLKQPRYSGDPRVLMDLHLVGLYYQYPEFVLLGSRWSTFADIGVTWE